ncbi:MAG: glycosyltransferase [Clostridia bacterium]|nr:glycosyltransferase [Clostridia bacterium]
MLLSVIIPAYNCKDTLSAAVFSVAENFKDTEIIIIDDGSTDGTQSVINNLKNSYSCIKTERIKNSGPANARNVGLKLATGDFVMFLDSDDTFRKKAFKAVSSSLNNDTDLLIFGFRQNFYSKAQDKIYSSDSPFTVSEYYRNNLLNQVWNKVYRREFLINNNIVFKDYRYGEDRIFNAEVLKNAPRVTTIPDVLYNYNIDKSVSLISGYIPEKFDACKEINCYFSELCEDKSTADYMFLKNIVSCMTVLFAENCKLTSEEKKAVIKEIITDEDVKKAMESKQNSTANEIIRKIIRTENVFLNFTFAFSVAFIQKHFLPVFLKFRK